MSTLLTPYVDHLTAIFDGIDDRRDIKPDITTFQSCLKRDFPMYHHTLQKSAPLFVRWNRNRFVVPRFDGCPDVNTLSFLIGVVDRRYRASRALELHFIRQNLDSNYFVKLKHTLQQAYPMIHDNRRLAMYSLYHLDICAPNDLSIQSFNDPTTSGFIELAQNRIAQLRNVESKKDYVALLDSYLK